MMDLGTCVAKFDGDKLILLKPSETINGVPYPPMELVIEGANYLMELRNSLDSHFDESSSLLHGDILTVNLKITQLLQEVGIPVHIKGYRYFQEAVEMAYDEPHSIHNMFSRIYGRIANKYKTTSSGVERAMRHSVEVAWSNPGAEIRRWFRQRPSNAQLISTMFNMLNWKKHLVDDV